MRRTIVIIALFSFATSVLSQSGADTPELRAAQKAYLAKLEQPIILRGDFFRAASVAYEDFGRLLRKRADDSSSAANRSLAERMSKVENFDINIEQSEGTFIVEFTATVRGGRDPVFGGGARYIIDGKAFTISDKVYSK